MARSAGRELSILSAAAILNTESRRPATYTKTHSFKYCIALKFTLESRHRIQTCCFPTNPFSKFIHVDFTMLLLNTVFLLSAEVCNSEEVPEVEIVSLLQEYIPKYRLRADSLTQFGGKVFLFFELLPD